MLVLAKAASTSTSHSPLPQNNNYFAMVTHVLFDFDGTLVNSIDRGIEVVDEIIQKQNPNLRISEKLTNCIPNITSFPNLVKLINAELNLSLDPTEYAAIIAREARTKLQLLPGVEKLVKHLHAHGIPMAVSTGGARWHYETGVANFSEFFAKYMDHAVCATDDPDVKNQKPAPDCYIVAANRFSQPPSDMSEVLIFEDSITGLKGAIASGGQTVFVSKWKSMFSAENQPFIEKAVLVCSSLEEFKPEQFGLPPYEE